MAFIGKSKIEEMYRHFTDGFLNELKSDEFYDYFINAIRSGESNISIYEKYVERNIDLRWVETIENTIIPLDNIIRNPMRFIKNEEEIVPIEMVRNVTTESIRHLAQHTSMIAQVKGDEVTPSKMLNIVKEESFETYENRFIYTLIAKLEYFLDKRLQALKTSKDIIDRLELKLNGNFTAGHDKVTYDVSVSCETPHVELEDHDNLIHADISQMNAMQRIERIRKILYNFKSSALIKSLYGCALVRPPLNMTNVLTKNQNFKKTVELWVFIESYDDIGYSVSHIDRQVEPSDMYMNELFSVLTMQYIVMKKNSGNMQDLGNYEERHTEQTPNIVKKDIDDFIDTFDLDIEEVRRIFLDRIQKKIKKRKMEYAKIKDVLTRAIALESEKLEEEAKIRKEREKKEAELLKKELARQAAIEKKRREEEQKRLMEEELERQKQEELERQRQEEELAKAQAEAKAAEEPVEETVEEPVEETTEEPIEETAEEPVEEATEKSVEETVEEPVEETVEEPVEETTEEPVEEATEESVEETVEEPIEETTEEPVEEATEESVEETVEEPIEETTEEPVEETTEEPVEETTEEPVEETTEEPVEETTEEPIEETTEEPVEETVEESVEEAVNESAPEEKKKPKLSFRETWLKIKEKLERKPKEASIAPTEQTEEKEAVAEEITEDVAENTSVNNTAEASEQISDEAYVGYDEAPTEDEEQPAKEELTEEGLKEFVDQATTTYETVEEFFAPEEEIAKLHATDDGNIVYEGDGKAEIVYEADGSQSIYVNGILFVKLRKKRRNNSFRNKTYSSARKKPRNKRRLNNKK